MTTIADLVLRYRRARRLQDSAFSGDLVLNASVYPHWEPERGGFSYNRQLPGGNVERRFVDVQSVCNSPEEPQAIQAENQLRRLSPNGCWAIFKRDHNLWLEKRETAEISALTSDGDEHFSYGGTASAYGRQEMESLEAIWSPNSKRVLAVIKDNRNVGAGAPLIEHIPSDGSIRPRTSRLDRRVALPGDATLEMYRFVVIDVQTGKVQAAPISVPVSYPPYVGYFSGGRGWWDLNGRDAYLIEQTIDQKAAKVLKWNVDTNSVKTLFEDWFDCPVNFIPLSHVTPLVCALQETNELIWYSERSGQAHLYLYDLAAGVMKNAITSGDWLVRNLLHVDEARREVWIQTAGRKPGRNPYYSDICRINIDSGVLIEVVSTDHDYAVCAPFGRVNGPYMLARGVSPDGAFAVATRSTEGAAPVSLLFDRNGNELLTVEEADLSDLPPNWRWPQSFKCKTADGETDNWGVMFFPSDFDDEKSYPVIDCSFHCFTPTGSFSNGLSGNWVFLTAQALAELGFIIVMINTREAGLRPRAHNKTRKAISVRYNQDDCVAAIKELAARYSFIDAARVGVYSFGGLASPVEGLLRRPEFYSVGVAQCPGSDYRLMAAMTGMMSGDSDELPLESDAANLQGKLLLIHGMLDDVIPVATTFRIVEALQKANKDFDMLLLPNMGHGGDGYVTRRIWGYFVEHLLGETPPAPEQSNATMAMG